MLDFSDTPYEFFPAKPNRALIRVGQLVNRSFILPGKHHRIQSVEVRGGRKLVDVAKRKKSRLLYVPNHPTHSDAQVVFETQRQIGTVSCFMTAYDVVQRNPRLIWIMQRGGCFSVDRDGNDSRAMKAAMEILVNGDYGLTIFPEGNVYLMNDLVMPFLLGAAFIAMKAQKDLGDTHPIFLTPVSIKITHLSNIRAEILDVLEQLATDMGTSLDRKGNYVQELRRIGVIALDKALRQRGILPTQLQGGDIRGLIEHSANSIIEQLEQKMDLTARSSDNLDDRIRMIRGKIHEIRTNTEQRALNQVAAVWADEAITALRILSYTGSYVKANPTMDRYSETVEKLYEDIYGMVLHPIGNRHAFVQISEPIDLTKWLHDFTKRPKYCVRSLTHEVENAVQNGLDELNKGNSLPGGEIF